LRAGRRREDLAIRRAGELLRVTCHYRKVSGLSSRFTQSLRNYYSDLSTLTAIDPNKRIPT
jgi:hypothetical protein